MLFLVQGSVAISTTLVLTLIMLMVIIFVLYLHYMTVRYMG